MPVPFRKVRWGVLGVARIATLRVIPGMQRGALSEVTAIASRDLTRAREAADAYGIRSAYASYDDLLADPDVEAVYIPLPNHMHVPWTIRAAEAGKHVLCEKPIGLNAAEVEQIIDARNRTRRLIQEAFMIRMHPQWLQAIELVRAGRIGPVRFVSAVFSYFNVDPMNVRNIEAFGGGGLLDIGCYLTHVSRWIFDREPARVAALVERDPGLGVDRLSSMLLDFGDGHAGCTCSTQSVPHQRVSIFGVRGRIEIEIPFNAPSDRPCRIVVDDGSDLVGGGQEVIEVDVCDQYTLQGDAMSRAIREYTAAPLPLEDALANTRVLDAARRSAAAGTWESI